MAKTRPKTGKKGKKYRIELTPLSVLLWGILVFFILTWIFVLGILVGRGFLPGNIPIVSDLKDRIGRLQELVVKKKPYNSRSQEEIDDAPKLDFYERLASKKDKAKKNWKSGKELDIPEKETSSVVVEAPGKPPMDQKEPPETLVPAGDQFTVQIASLGEIHKAEEMIRRLINLGYDAYYYKADVQGRTFYRIRCGRFRSREEALVYSQKIEKEAGLKGFVSKIE